jgi:hypothetical protein
MARVKTASLGPSIERARQLMGDDRIREVVSKLPANTQLLLSRELRAAEWVDTDHWLPFQQALLDEHFEGDDVQFRGFVREVSAHEVGLFSKLAIRMLLSPERLLRRLAKRWPAYSDTGTFEVVSRQTSEAGKRVSVKLSAFKSDHAVFGILLHGLIEHLLQMTGGRAMEVRCTANRVVLGEVETELVVEYG